MKLKVEITQIEVPVITKEEVVILTLPVEYAQLLYDISCKIGGDPVKSRRRLVDRLRGALLKTGKMWRWDSQSVYDAPDLMSSPTLYFKSK